MNEVNQSVFIGDRFSLFTGLFPNNKIILPEKIIRNKVLDYSVFKWEQYFLI